MTDEERHPLDWYPGEPAPEAVVAMLDTEAHEPASLRALAARLESAPWHPSVDLAVSLVRGAALALEQADGEPAMVSGIRKGLLAAERLFKLRGAQLIESNLLVAQRIRTEWELGRMLRDTIRRGGDHRSKRVDPTLVTLGELGVAKWDSQKFQRLAEIDRDDLEGWISDEVNDRELSTAGALNQWKRFIRDAERERQREEAAARPAPSPESIPDMVRIEVADARALPLENDTVDLIVTSPPYALDVSYDGDGDVAAEDWPVFMYDWLVEALRISKPAARLALNIPLDTRRGGLRPTYAEAVMAALQAGWTYQATIVWHENNTTTGNRSLGSVNSSARPCPVDSSEMVALFSKGEWGPSSENPDDIEPEEWQEYGRGPWSFSGESRSWEGHPAAFPEELPYRLIRYLCRVGDLVCDPFSGSGSTATVATRLGRQFVGFDISEAYVRSSQRRVLEG